VIDDQVFSLLEEANPVPDPGVLDQLPTRVTPPQRGSAPMQTIEPDTRTPAGPRRTVRAWPLVMAASVIAIAVLGALLLTRDDPGTEVPLDTPDTAGESLPAPLSREEHAVMVATRFYDRVAVGDVDGAIEMTNAEVRDVDADQEMWSMIAVGARFGRPWAVHGCEPVSSMPPWVEVDCTVTLGDPVFVELGVADLTAPARVYDDGSVVWLPFREGDFSLANQAYADYLRAFHPEEYGTVCSPAAYEPGTVAADRGLALTESCAELYVPLGDAVATWIDDGRPEPGGSGALDAAD
jgi:hypothetical protein